MADRDGNGGASTRPRIRRAGDQRPPRLPPASRRRGGRRLGRVLRELPKRVGDWMERLQGEGVRGADLVFACIGPALEIFSRYTKVETADGREVALAEYLEKVWEVVGRSALAQVLGTAEAKARNGAAGAVEEDARLTALFLWTLQSTDGEAADAASDEGEDEESSDEDDDEEGSSRGKAKGFTLVFDVVRRFAQPLGIELPKWEGRVIETRKGVVRLLPIAERAKQLFGEDGAQAVAARLEEEAATMRGRSLCCSQKSAPRRPRSAGAAEAAAGGRASRFGRSLAAARRGHDPGPCPRRDAPSGRRPHQRAARAAQGRAGARPGLPAPRQRPFGALPEGQRGEAAARRDALAVPRRVVRNDAGQRLSCGNCLAILGRTASADTFFLRYARSARRSAPGRLTVLIRLDDQLSSRPVCPRFASEIRRVTSSCCARGSRPLSR